MSANASARGTNGSSPNTNSINSRMLVLPESFGPNKTVTGAHGNSTLTPLNTEPRNRVILTYENLELPVPSRLSTLITHDVQMAMTSTLGEYRYSRPPSSRNGRYGSHRCLLV